MVYAETQALMCAISRIVVVVAYWQVAIISFGSTRALWKLRSCFDHVRLKEGRSIKKGILTTTAKPIVDLLTITNGEFGWKNYTVSGRIRIIQLRPMSDGRLYWVLGAGLILRKRKVLHSHYFLALQVLNRRSLTYFATMEIFEFKTLKENRLNRSRNQWYTTKVEAKG